MKKRYILMLLGGLVFQKAQAQLNANVFLGYKPGASNTTGTNNVFLGNLTGYANTTGYQNVFIGQQAGSNNINGAFNLFIGASTGSNNLSGNYNLFLGNQAGYSNTSGQFNTFLGNGSGYKNNGSYNTFLGHNTGYNNSSGSNNAFIGVAAGASNLTGSDNVFIGNSAGFTNNNGQLNVFIGQNAGYFNTGGSDNVYIGREAGRNNVGSFNTFIGRGTGVSTNNSTLTNVTAIGADAQVTASNSVILGNAANVGIGTSAPQNKLEITKGTANQSGLRLTNLTSNSPASATNQTKFLSVNANGDVILASLNASTRLAANESLWQTQGDFIQNTNPQGVIIGSQINRTPPGYKLFVEDGILTEKVKVAIRSTEQWSDKVFSAGYRLPSLEEVSAYIARHHHLPDVPSAEEVVSKGLDLGQMDARLLQKIEELTLYLLEQDKRLNALQLENERIKNELTQLKANR